MALAFSGNGQRLVAVTGDNRHTVNVLHWKSKKIIHSDVGHNGSPPQVGRKPTCTASTKLTVHPHLHHIHGLMH